MPRGSLSISIVLSVCTVSPSPALHRKEGPVEGEAPKKFGAALVTIMLADELRRDRICVNSIYPGWVRSDMGGEEATKRVEEGAAGIV